MDADREEQQPIGINVQTASRIAVANISQLKIMVHPNSGEGVISLPENHEERNAALQSLEKIFGNLKNPELCFRDNQGNPSARDNNPTTLTISLNLVKELVAAGVDSPAINAVRGRSLGR